MSANTDLFNEAISLHQSKKFDAALNAYLKLLDKGQDASITHEQASTISQNIAVLYMQQNKPELAYVFNKKSLALNPRNTAAEQFAKNSLNNFKVSEIARDISWTEQLNGMGLKYIPFEALAVMTVVFVFLSLKLFFNYLLTQKKNLLENKTPPVLSWSFYGYLMLFILTFSLLWAKNSEATLPTGMIKSAQASVQTAAGANQAIITEINLGHVVQILQTKEVEGIIYAQIKVPGAFSGWIKKTDLEPLNSAN
jgi:tetratricopeptide (TPR) repeat protein